MVVVEILREAEHHPAAVARIVNVRGAPALQRFDLAGDGRLRPGFGAQGGLVGGFAIEQRAAVRRQAHLRVMTRFRAQGAFELSRSKRDRLGQRVIVGRRFDVRAGLQQRQGAAADEVDLEAEQHVVGARRRRQRLGIGADAEQRADEAADVRRHGDDDVAARHRTQRFRHFAVLRPTRPRTRARSPSPARRNGCRAPARRAG